ncbi:Hypothetical protein FKW44_000727 [Caligus rogercresseyi]|uniref:Uncharacterized protein n=1 Tax=Caligus rogercresseyi TaxID=217165 RepID=A0A7T8KHV6_CALRO|nr:Hypothetical protein FKW44_000727 [Caligus rogercresseyi]
MYFIKFHISSFDSLQLGPPHGGGNTAGISSSDKDFHGPGHPQQSEDRFYLEKRKTSLQLRLSSEAKATLSHG